MSPFFQYEALSKTGLLERGEVMASDPADARVKLRRTGLTSVLAVEPVERLHKRKISSTALQDALSSLSILLKAGLPLLPSLQSVSSRARSAGIRSAFLSMSGAVEGGQSLTDAATVTGIFPDSLLAGMRVGEESGRLAETLTRAADALAKENAFRRRMEGLLMYPCIVFTVSMIVIGFLLAFVVPQLSRIFEGSTQPLPWITRGLLAVSGFINAWGTHVAVLLVIALAGALVFTRTETGGRLQARMLLHIGVIRNMYLSRWLAALAVLLESGVDLVKALDVSRVAGGNRELSPVIDGLRDGVKRGRSFTALLREQPVFVDVPSELLAAGESGGQLRSACAACAATLEDQVARRLERFATLLEPLLLCGLGLLAAGIVVSVLLPIMELSGSIR
ncbi:type II secretion system F family protein [bacterium]|nr:type II secretion system F family protein [bacterium]